MYVLPITCNQILYIGVGLLIALGSYLFYIGLEEKETVYISGYFIWGIVILGVLGMLGLVHLVIKLMIWLDDNVKCKCDA